MTKSIYLEKQTEQLLEQYATAKGLTISKAINVLIQAQLSTDKPVIAPKQESPAKELETKLNSKGQQLYKDEFGIWRKM